MVLHCQCPLCGTALRFKERESQMRVRCPQCQRVFVVPAPQGVVHGSGESIQPVGPVVATSLVLLALLGAGLLLWLIGSAVSRSDLTANGALDETAATENHGLATGSRLAGTGGENARKSANDAVKDKAVPFDELWSAAHARHVAPARSSSPGVATEAERSRMTPEEVYAKASPSVVIVYTRNTTGGGVAQGSGFFVNANGLLITNYHVIAGANKALVGLADKSWIAVAGVLAADKDWDLVLLQVAGDPTPFVPLAERSGKVGEEVFVISSPHRLANTFSRGMISGRRKVGGVSLIQTDASVSHGSSGGPLLSANGHVVGVISKRIGEDGELNFAIDIAHVRALMRRAGAVRPLSDVGE